MTSTNGGQRGIMVSNLGQEDPNSLQIRFFSKEPYIDGLLICSDQVFKYLIILLTLNLPWPLYSFLIAAVTNLAS